MASKIVWIRPSGREITTNGTDASIQKAAELGWKPKDLAKPIEKPIEKPSEAVLHRRSKKAD